MKIEVDSDTIDKLVVSVLKEDYIHITENIRNIENLVASETVEPYVLADLEHDKNLLDAVTKVLSYYTIKEEFDRFIEENK
jgi:hypothetical protein